MRPELEKRIARLADDRQSGASEILDEAIAILRDARLDGEDIPAVARGLCGAQPTMAPIWNAAIEALASAGHPERFDRFVARVARAPQAVARFAVDYLSPSEGPNGGEKPLPLRVVTISSSRTVLHVLTALGRVRPLQVACSESRPGLEGRRLATRLAALDVQVTMFSDAGIAHALRTADAVVVGADAVSPDYFLNKSGTHMLAATAMQQGVPVHVVSSRDKFVTRALAIQLRPHEGPPSELWAEAPPRVIVRNPYFESTPLDLVTSVITDVGVLSPADVAELCDSLGREIPAGVLELLQSS